MVNIFIVVNSIGVVSYIYIGREVIQQDCSEILYELYIKVFLSAFKEIFLNLNR